jgi:hypothetical protein
VTTQPPDWRNPRLPIWLRVATYARTHAPADGVLVLDSGELRHAIACNGTPPRQSDVSVGIRTAVRRGLLARGSGARTLIVQPTQHSRG